MNRIFVGLTFALTFTALATDARADDPALIVNDSDATLTHDCAQAPRVVINGSENAITVTGHCTKIAVNGGGIHLTIEAVDHIAVNGGENTIDIGAAGKIAVQGADNTVTWKTGTTGKRPKVSNLGQHNRISQAK